MPAPSEFTAAGFRVVATERQTPTLFAPPAAAAARRDASPSAPRPPAPFLPMSRADLRTLGWDECDVVLVTGDAYVDHPSFGAALIGRLLEAHGFRVGVVAQPDWRSADAFRALGRPRVMFGVTAGNMDSMVNRYTAEKRIRSDDAYSPDGAAGRRPDRSSIVYAQRCREAFPAVPVVLGGIEASLRRVAHFDYWSETVRRSIVLDAKADLLIYGNGERAVVEIAHRLAAGEPIGAIDDVRGTAFVRPAAFARAGFSTIDSTDVDAPGRIDAAPSPYDDAEPRVPTPAEAGALVTLRRPSPPPSPTDATRAPTPPRERTVIRMPSFEAVSTDAVLYAHASRVLHLEANPGNARALAQAHGERQVWLNPPPIPLATAELDALYELPYARRPHPAYGRARIPAYEMIKSSVTIMRGCFGGCTFCSITEHEGRIIQSRSAPSVLREIESVRDKTPGFSGVISDLGGPTANMYRMACKDPAIEAACRLPSCVYPEICANLRADHTPLIDLYRRARGVPGVKKVLVASGVRYDLAATSPAYVKELATHHVGGYLKIAPEHTEDGPLAKMLKPGIAAYEKFRTLFDRFSVAAGKKQYLIPYFIAAHPGTTDEDMLELALWLKRNGFRADQVQAFMPTPMATATAMYHTGLNPLRRVRRTGSETVRVPRGLKVRRLHKALLRYHDPENWPLLREALTRMGRRDLIGRRPACLVPPEGDRATSGVRPGGAPRGRTDRTPPGGRGSGASRFCTQRTRADRPR